MSSGARVGLLAGTVAVLVLAFVLLSPGDDDPDTARAPTATAPATAMPAQTTTVEEQPEPAPPAAPEFERIRVRDGRPVDGVQTITVEKGDRARIQISSPDTTDEIHLHGYDLYRDLKAGGSVRYSFEANAEGIFEIELHGTGTQIGRLVVEP